MTITVTRYKKIGVSISTGQVWRDNDPRHTSPRFLRVEAINGEHAWCVTCNEDGTDRLVASGGCKPRRPAKLRSKLSRFGKAGRIGFTFVR